MSTVSIITITKMMETLPKTMQNQVVTHLREYLEELQDEIEWDRQFQKSQKNLIAAAKKAKKEIAEGKAKPFNSNLLSTRSQA